MKSKSRIKGIITIGTFLICSSSMDSLAQEATYTYSVDTTLIKKQWMLLGGEINNDAICPKYAIKFNDSILFNLNSVPYVEYDESSYSFNDGCNGGGGALVYRDYMIVGLSGGSSSKYCNYMANDTLKAISKAFGNIIDKCSFVFLNDTLMLQNGRERIYLKKARKDQKNQNKKSGG